MGSPKLLVEAARKCTMLFRKRHRKSFDETGQDELESYIQWVMLQKIDKYDSTRTWLDHKSWLVFTVLKDARRYAGRRRRELARKQDLDDYAEVPSNVTIDELLGEAYKGYTSCNQAASSKQRALKRMYLATILSRAIELGIIRMSYINSLHGKHKLRAIDAIKRYAYLFPKAT